jgi:hypothetical protein
MGKAGGRPAAVVLCEGEAETAARPNAGMNVDRQTSYGAEIRSHSGIILDMTIGDPLRLELFVGLSPIADGTANYTRTTTLDN